MASTSARSRKRSCWNRLADTPAMKRARVVVSFMLEIGDIFVGTRVDRDEVLTSDNYYKERGDVCNERRWH